LWILPEPSRRPQVIAHRGGRRWAPENTLAAFRKSLELGVDGIELDVQRCASGELVVFHDSDLVRTTSGAGTVATTSYTDLCRLDAGRWFHESFAGERIPLLSEVFDLVSDQCMVHVEIKNTPRPYPGIESDFLALAGTYPQARMVVSSIDHKLLMRLHEKAPSLGIAVLAACRFLDLPRYAEPLAARYFNVALDCLTADTVTEAHSVGIYVNTWTVNTETGWAMALEFGVDAIITDDPEGLVAYLRTS
jgi:glycerophosphoryl diester phosphodiesterase